MHTAWLTSTDGNSDALSLEAAHEDIKYFWTATGSKCKNICFDAPPEELGLDDDEEPTEFEPDDLDPEGRELSLEDFYSVKEGTPQSLAQELYSDDVYGPSAVVLAGFRAEELAMVRAILDSAGGHAVKVIPVKEELLYERMSTAIHLPEPDWGKARPVDWTRGGAWGSQRTILFSGMKLAAQAALVELLEEAGLPPVCAALAVEDDADKQLGTVLAEAVQAQRTRRNPHKDIWEELDRSAKELPDVEEYLKQRVQEIQQDIEAGNLENVIVRDNLDDEGGEMTLADVQNLELDEDEDYEEERYEEGVEQSEAASRPAIEMSLDHSHQKAEASRAGQPDVPFPQGAERHGFNVGPGEDAGYVLTGQQPGPVMTRDPQAEAEPSMPPRTKQRDDRVELSHSALSDPMTQAEGEALLQSLGSSGVAKDEEKARKMQQMQKQAQSSGKFFMDSLAQNVGLAADPDMQDSQSPDSQQNLDMIDAIAEGRQVHLSHSISEEASAVQANPMSSADVTSAEQASSPRAPREDVADQRPPTINLVSNPEDGDKEAQRIMADLDKKFKKLRKETDKDKVTEALRKEAWDPTKDAIKAALACGIRAEDLKRLIDEEAKEKEKDEASWATSWSSVPPVMPTDEEKAATRSGAADYDIFSPMPIDRRREQLVPVGFRQQGDQENGSVSGDSGSEEEGVSGTGAGSSSTTGTMTKKELKEIALRRNLNYAQLLADAEAQGLALPDE
ncbi:g1809 [Coccomyxa elongata]